MFSAVADATSVFARSLPGLERPGYAQVATTRRNPRAFKLLNANFLSNTDGSIGLKRKGRLLSSPRGKVTNHSSSRFFFGFSSVNKMLATKIKLASAAMRKKMAGRPG